MDDLPRLIDDPQGSALARSLLTSARGDVPSSDSRARAAKRLGVAAALAVGASAGSEAGALVAAGKLALVLLALGGVVGLAMWQSPVSAPVGPVPHQVAPAPRSVGIATSPSPPSVTPSPSVAPAPAEPPVSAPVPARPAPVRRVSASAPPAPARSPSVPPVTPRSAEVAPTEPLPEIAAPEPSAAAPDTPAPPPTAAVATPPAPATSDITAGPSRLAAEVALLDRARAGLVAGDYPAALAALAEYHQRFASGDLDAEAQMVMIEIVIAQRDIPRARTLGTEFLSRFPRSPLAQRVRSLLDRLPDRLPK